MDETTEQNEEIVSQQLVPTLLSLAIGAASIGRDALSTRVRSWEEQTALPPGEGDTNFDFGDVAVGLIFRSEQILSSTGRVVANGARTGGQALVGTARLVGADRMARSAAGVELPVIGSLDAAVKDLQRLGRERRTRARALAETAMRSSTEVSIREITVRAVEEVSQSARAREVIRTQTAGAAQLVASEVRDVARSADARLERGIRSLFHRKESEHPEPETANDVG